MAMLALFSEDLTALDSHRSRNDDYFQEWNMLKSAPFLRILNQNFRILPPDPRYFRAWSWRNYRMLLGFVETQTNISPNSYADEKFFAQIQPYFSRFSSPLPLFLAIFIFIFILTFSWREIVDVCDFILFIFLFFPLALSYVNISFDHFPWIEILVFNFSENRGDLACNAGGSLSVIWWR